MAYWHSTSLAYLAFQMYDDARARVDRALAVSGDAWEILNTKGNILASLGLAEAALQTYHAALDAMPAEAALGQKTVRTNLGELLSMEGKYSEADAYFAQALEALPSSDVALQRALNYRYWALAEFEQRRWEEAERLAGQGIATADLALQMDPTNPTAQKLLAALRLFVALRLGATDSAP